MTTTKQQQFMCPESTQVPGMTALLNWTLHDFAKALEFLRSDEPNLLLYPCPPPRALARSDSVLTPPDNKVPTPHSHKQQSKQQLVSRNTPRTPYISPLAVGVGVVRGSSKRSASRSTWTAWMVVCPYPPCNPPPHCSQTRCRSDLNQRIPNTPTLNEI